MMMGFTVIYVDLSIFFQIPGKLVADHNIVKILALKRHNGAKHSIKDKNCAADEYSPKDNKWEKEPHNNKWSNCWINVTTATRKRDRQKH